MPKSPKECIEEAVSLVRENLVECANELIEKFETGLLCDGFVRKTAELLKFTGNDLHALKMAENIVKEESLKYTAYWGQLYRDALKTTNWRIER